MLNRAYYSVQFNSVAQSCPTLCDPMNAERPTSLSITNSGSLLKFMSIEAVMPSSHLIIIRELQIKPSMRYHLTLVRMAMIKKKKENLQPINAREDVEKEPSCTTLGNAN